MRYPLVRRTGWLPHSTKTTSVDKKHRREQDTIRWLHTLYHPMLRSPQAHAICHLPRPPPTIVGRPQYRLMKRDRLASHLTECAAPISS